MDKSQLRRQIAEWRQSLFDEGFLNDYFLRVVEPIEQSQPNFVEKIIHIYLTQSTLYLQELAETLGTKPLNLGTVERLILKLKGGGACMGAGKVTATVEEMWGIFKSKDTNGLIPAFEKVKAEHANLRMHLEAYAELLRELREDDPPDEASDNREDLESVGSNDVSSG